MNKYKDSKNLFFLNTFMWYWDFLISYVYNVYVLD